MSSRTRPPEIPAEPVAIEADDMRRRLTKATASAGQHLPASVRDVVTPALAHRFGAVRVERRNSDAPPGPRQSMPQTNAAELEARSIADALHSAPHPPSSPAARRTIDASLDQVRVHHDGNADAATRAVGARALTVGHHVLLRSDRWSPGSAAGRSLLAHETTHVMQQARDGVGVQADLESPTRYQELNIQLFRTTPGGAAPQTWQNAAPGNRGTAGVIFDEFVQFLRDLMADEARINREGRSHFGGTVPNLTSESEAKDDAVTADARLRAKYPFMPSAPESELRAAVGVQTTQQTQADDYIRQWLVSRLYTKTSLGEFAITDSDARVQQLLTDLLRDSFAGDKIRILATRAAAYTVGEGRSRQVFLNKGVSDDQRLATLLHEIAHFYVDPNFKRWIDGTNAPREFEEGFTEFIARKAQSPEPTQGSYESQFQVIVTRVATRAPLSDIARAYFLGETWRLETRSAVSRELFASQVGIRTPSTPREERQQSATASGIFQTVQPGAHFRFMDLGNDESAAKPEHIRALHMVIQQFVSGHPEARVRFVGHASTPGSESHNEELSKRRSRTFYAAARSEGVPARQLLDADDPPHFGERRPTAVEEDPITRAFNRRVEMFITTAGQGAATQEAGEGNAD